MIYYTVQSHCRLQSLSPVGRVQSREGVKRFITRLNNSVSCMYVYTLSRHFVLNNNMFRKNNIEKKTKLINMTKISDDIRLIYVPMLISLISWTVFMRRRSDFENVKNDKKKFEKGDWELNYTFCSHKTYKQNFTCPYSLFKFAKSRKFLIKSIYNR